MDLFTILWWLLIAYVVIQLVRLALADGDLQLMWAEKFGKKTCVLRDQVVWVTGASAGIGEALAYELARAGCRLVLSARRQQELERVKKQCLLMCSLKEEHILVLPLDVRDADKHQAALDDVLNHFGQVDILVNNAGRSQRALIEDSPLEVTRQIMDLNFISVVSLTKTVSPHMKERGCGHVVVTSSLAGKIGVPFAASYSATKYALQGFFDAFRVENYPTIAVTLACPGPVFSDVQQEAFGSKIDEPYGQGMDPNEKRMATGRCAELMAIAMANRLPEVWVSQHPPLLFTYAQQYAPNLSRWVACRLGVKGINTMRNGRNVLNK